MSNIFNKNLGGYRENYFLSDDPENLLSVSSTIDCTEFELSMAQ